MNEDQDRQGDAPAQEQEHPANEEGAAGMFVLQEGQEERHFPPEMKLSEQESDWAWDLVHVVEKRDSGMTQLSDFEYAQYALATQGNIQEAVRKIKAVQLFQTQYGLQNTVEEGMAVVEEFIRSHPGVFLHVEGLGVSGCHVAMDYGNFYHAKVMESDDSSRNALLFFYYLTRMHQPTL